MEALVASNLLYSNTKVDMKATLQTLCQFMWYSSMVQFMQVAFNNTASMFGYSAIPTCSPAGLYPRQRVLEYQALRWVYVQAPCYAIAARLQSVPFFMMSSNNKVEVLAADANNIAITSTMQLLRPMDQCQLWRWTWKLTMESGYTFNDNAEVNYKPATR